MAEQFSFELFNFSRLSVDPLPEMNTRGLEKIKDCFLYRRRRYSFRSATHKQQRPHWPHGHREIRHPSLDRCVFVGQHNHLCSTVGLMFAMMRQITWLLYFRDWGERLPEKSWIKNEDPNEKKTNSTTFMTPVLGDHKPWPCSPQG